MAICCWPWTYSEVCLTYPGTLYCRTLIFALQKDVNWRQSLGWGREMVSTSPAYCLGPSDIDLSGLVQAAIVSVSVCVCRYPVASGGHCFHGALHPSGSYDPPHSPSLSSERRGLMKTTRLEPSVPRSKRGFLMRGKNYTCLWI